MFNKDRGYNTARERDPQAGGIHLGITPMVLAQSPRISFISRSQITRISVKGLSVSGRLKHVFAERSWILYCSLGQTRLCNQINWV